MTSVSYRSVDVEEAMRDAEKILGINNESTGRVMKAIEGFPRVNWMKVDGWEELSDIEIINNMEIFYKIGGNVSIVSDASYGKGNGAFEVLKEELLHFVGNHLNIFGECLFNGDVLFIDKNKSLMFVFHHSGAWAKFG